MSLFKKWYFFPLSLVLSIAGQLRAASAIDTYGINPEDMAMGNVSGIVAGDETSLTYAAAANPARLVLATHPLFGVNTAYSQFHLRDLGRPPTSSPSGLAASSYRPSQAEGMRATTFGFNFPFWPGVNFGMAGYLPSDKLASIQAVSAQDVGYLRYDERQRKPELHTALGIAVGHDLALGLGAYYTVSASGDVAIALSDKDSQGRIGMSLQPVATPYGGLHWGRKLAFEGGGDSRLDFAATYRDEQHTDAKMHTTFSASNDAFSLPANIDAALVAFYDPAIARLATGFQTNRAAVFLGYERAYWSHYRSAQLNLGGDDIVLLSGARPPAENDMVRLDDTDSYQLGFSFKRDYGHGQAALRLGFEQHGSALPSDVVRPVVVDLARNVYAVGIGYQVGGTQLPGPQKMNAMAFDIGFQRTALIDRHFLDASGQPYRAGGQVSTWIGGCRLEL